MNGKFCFGPDKTQTILINGQQEDRRSQSPLFMGIKKVKLASEIKMFGVTVDEKNISLPAM